MECHCATAGFCPHNKMNLTHQDWLLCQTREGYRKIFRMRGERFPEKAFLPECVQIDDLGQEDKEGFQSRKTVVVRQRHMGAGDLVARVLRRPARLLNRDNCGGCKQRQARLNRISTKIEAWTGGWVKLPFLAKAEGSWEWGVGMMLAPRPNHAEYVSRSLPSLHAAGWDLDEITVFAEPGSPIVEGVRVITNETKFGGWKNFKHCLKTLVEERPDAKAYMVCQDDTLYCKGMRKWFEANLWPKGADGEQVGYIQPYCSAAHGRVNAGRLQRFQRGFLWGAVCCVFTPEAARKIIECDEFERKSDSPNKIDTRISYVFARLGWSRWYLYPSLVQHIGNDSAMLHGGAAGRMRANTFVGEDFDVFLEGKANENWTPKEYPKIDVIIPGHNQAEMTIECIDSFRRNAGVEWRLVYADNASTDGTVPKIHEYIRQHEMNDAMVIAFNNNLGWSVLNYVIDACDSPYVWLGNNDTVLAPNCLRRLLPVLDDPAIAMVSAVTDDGGYNSIKRFPELRNVLSIEQAREMSVDDVALKLQSFTKTVERSMLGFNAVLVKRETLKQVRELGKDDAYFDPAFRDGLGADDWWCHLVRKRLGMKVVTHIGAFCRHYGQRTFKATGRSRSAADAYRILRERGALAR